MIVAVVAACALVLAVSAGAVVGGAPDAGHVYVGAVEAPDGSGGFELCSGSLISATVFVTAAHCFPQGDTMPVSVTFAQDISDPNAVFVTGAVTIYPNFCPGCGNGLPRADTGDFAVVVLDTPVSLTSYADLPMKPGLDDSLKNQPLDVVGYGIQGFSGKAPTAVGSRAVATTTVKGNGAISSEFLKLLDGPGACPGDSGGPDLVHGTNTIAAITTFQGGNPTCNGVSYSERLDTTAALTFINSFR